jgi:hypothetical protein
MQDDLRFEPQGKGYNALPHVLTAYVDHWRSSGITWRVKCPYEGPSRPCASMEECLEHPAAPQDPYDRVSLSREDKLDPEFQQEVQEYKKALERWEDDHPDGHRHAVDRCWAEWVMDEGDVEPEYFLEPIPGDHPVTGPLRVLLGTRGYGEEADPVYRLWDDDKDGESRS